MTNCLYDKGWKINITRSITFPWCKKKKTQKLSSKTEILYFHQEAKSHAADSSGSLQYLIMWTCHWPMSHHYTMPVTLKDTSKLKQHQNMLL